MNYSTTTKCDHQTHHLRPYPLSPSPSSRPPKRRDPSTPPPDGFSFHIHKIIEPRLLLTRSIAVHTTPTRTIQLYLQYIQCVTIILLYLVEFLLVRYIPYDCDTPGERSSSDLSFSLGRAAPRTPRRAGSNRITHAAFGRGSSGNGTRSEFGLQQSGRHCRANLLCRLHAAQHAKACMWKRRQRWLQ